MSAPALVVQDVTVAFRGLVALDGVSLTLPVGERRAVIGPNGAGKTTLFNVLDGHIRPDRGTVQLLGRDVTSLATHHRTRLGMARTYQVTNLLKAMTVEDNVRLSVAGASPRLRRSIWRPLDHDAEVNDRTARLLKEWDLWDVRRRPVEELAYGRQRVLEIVMALGADPQVLLLDEPTAGLSLKEAELLTDVAAALPTTLALLVIEHDMDVAFRLGDVVTVLAGGKVIAEGPPEHVRADPVVIDTYLGERHGAA